MSRRLRIFFDGGCRPNPGMMEIAAVVRGVADVRRAIGEGSSHEAEWRALLHAVAIARDSGAADVVLLGDSLAIIRLATGVARPRPADEAHLAAYRAAAAAVPRLHIRHIGRSQNLAGIALAQAHPR